jgi:protocatechuate 3,4-dioxygenase beta subunit
MPIRVWRAARITGAAIALVASGKAGAQSATVSVRGLAYDSLRKAPLRDAIVTVAGSDARATTDHEGHFILEGIEPGVHTFSAQHGMLDSIGLSGVTTRSAVTDGQATLVLAVPSFATLWRAACGATPVPRDRGFIYGTVRDAAGLNPVSSASVDLTWLDIQASKETGIRQRRWRGHAVTDSSGSYTICGTPTVEGLRMQALSDSGASGIVDLFGSALRVQRRDLVLGPVSDSDLTRRATITGLVTDERGAPFADARVVVDEFGEMRSGADGRVVLRNVPAGTRQLEVLAIGRMPFSVVVELAAGDTAMFTAALRNITTLDVVRVTGTRRQRRMAEEFEWRRQNGAGYVLDSTDLAYRGRLSSAFEGFPGVVVQSTRGGQFTLTFPSPRGGRCVPVVWIDGRKTDLDELNVLRIGEVAAVEVYPRHSSAPSEFITKEICGSVVVWTRWAFS